MEKVPLNGLLGMLRAAQNQEQYYSLIRVVLNTHLNGGILDKNQLTGYQLAFYDKHESVFQQTAQSCPRFSADFLGGIFKNIVGAMSQGFPPYIIGGSSKSIYAKEQPPDSAFEWSSEEKHKIQTVKDFLDKSTDGVVYEEKVMTEATSLFFFTSMQFTHKHIFLFPSGEPNKHKSYV